MKSKSNEKEKHLQVAIVGNPNVGKTTIFNYLSGAHEKVANYSGVTVEHTSRELKHGDYLFEFIDLPGVYSLAPATRDESVTTAILAGRQKDKIDRILFVLDATSFKRNLYLLLQVLEIGIPTIVLFNKAGAAKRDGFVWDTDILSRELGVKVLHFDRSDKSLKHDLLHQIEDASVPVPQSSNRQMDKIISDFQEELPFPVLRHEAILLLSTGEKEKIQEKAEIILFPQGENIQRDVDILVQFSEQYKKPFLKKFSFSSIAEERYAVIRKISDQALTREKAPKNNPTRILDFWLTHPVTGLLALGGIFVLLFNALYFWSAPFMTLIDFLFSSFGDAVSPLLSGTPMFRDLLNDGIIGGVGGVLVFLPQIVFLFIFIAFLEESGYLARAVFLMDRFVAWSGLSGRSFIPMLSSYSCSIPGIMAARTIPERSARLATILTAPLVSCASRMPIYMLFISALIQPVYGTLAATFAFFFMNSLGALLTLPVAWTINRGLLKSPPSTFVLEMPPYQLPSIVRVLQRSYDAGKSFIKDAGSMILAFSVIIWALSYFPLSSHTAATDALQMEGSYLGQLGKTMQPLFAPLGFDWKISIGFLAAFPARELLISALGILYETGSSVDDFSSLSEKIYNASVSGDSVFTLPTIAALMVFFALSSQCFATLAVVRREAGSWKYAAFLFVYMTLLAYVLAFLTRQVLLLFF